MLAGLGLVALVDGLLIESLGADGKLMEMGLKRLETMRIPWRIAYAGV